MAVRQLQCVLVCVIVAGCGLCVFMGVCSCGGVWIWIHVCVCVSKKDHKHSRQRGRGRMGVKECANLSSLYPLPPPPPPNHRWCGLLITAKWHGSNSWRRWGGIEEGCRVEVQGDKFGPGRGSQMWEVLHHLFIEASLWSHLVLISW